MYGKDAYYQLNVVVTEDKVLALGRRENIDIDNGVDSFIELVYYALKFRVKKYENEIQIIERKINEAVKILTEPEYLMDEREVKEDENFVKMKLNEIRSLVDDIEKYKLVMSFVKRMKKYIEG